MNNRAGFVSIQGKPGGVTVTQTVYGFDYAIASLMQRLTPDKAVELAGALKQAAKAVWMHHNKFEDNNGRA